MPHQGTPTFDDIKRLALDEPILYNCCIFLRRGDISPMPLYFISGEQPD